MTEIELGVKRRCISCGTKFYDFLKAPIICPNCTTEFDPEQLLKSRKGRVSSKSAVIEAVKKEKDEEGFQDNTLLDETELDPDIDDEDDGLPSDEDEFITVSEDDDEATTTFTNNEEFMDNLTEDAGEDDIDEDEETNPSSKKEEE